MHPSCVSSFDMAHIAMTYTALASLKILGLHNFACILVTKFRVQHPAAGQKVYHRCSTLLATT